MSKPSLAILLLGLAWTAVASAQTIKPTAKSPPPPPDLSKLHVFKPTTAATAASVKPPHSSAPPVAMLPAKSREALRLVMAKALAVKPESLPLETKPGLLDAPGTTITLSLATGMDAATGLVYAWAQGGPIAASSKGAFYSSPGTRPEIGVTIHRLPQMIGTVGLSVDCGYDLEKPRVLFSVSVYAAKEQYGGATYEELRSVLGLPVEGGARVVVPIVMSADVQRLTFVLQGPTVENPAANAQRYVRWHSCTITRW